MERKPIFTGAASALITPMNSNGVDYENFRKLINWQIEEGIDALVIAGTSGEASTLTDEEHSINPYIRLFSYYRRKERKTQY